MVVSVGDGSIELQRGEVSALAALRARIELAIGGEASCDDAAGSATGVDDVTALRQAVTALVLPSMDVPWSGVPDGWVYAPDEAGKALYRSSLDASVAVRAKPTVTAAQDAERRRRDAAA
eukprot:2680054-Prymnesium_polylepis.1